MLYCPCIVNSNPGGHPVGASRRKKAVTREARLNRQPRVSRRGGRGKAPGGPTCSPQRRFARSPDQEFYHCVNPLRFWSVHGDGPQLPPQTRGPTGNDLIWGLTSRQKSGSVPPSVLALESSLALLSPSLFVPSTRRIASAAIQEFLTTKCSCSARSFVLPRA